MPSGVRYSGENNGFAKLLIPQLLTLSTQIIQSVARSIMLWANNLASGNPSPGQVLTVGSTATRLAEWSNLPKYPTFTTTGSASWHWTTGIYSNYLKFGSSVQVLNAAGGGIIGFPTAFPNAIFTAVLCWGDNNITGTPPGIQLIESQLTKSSIGFQSGSFHTRTVRVNYFAVGY